MSIGGYMGIQVGIAVRVGIGGYREYISRSCLPLPTHRAPIVIVLVIIMMVGKVVSDHFWQFLRLHYDALCVFFRRPPLTGPQNNSWG